MLWLPAHVRGSSGDGQSIPFQGPLKWGSHLCTQLAPTFLASLLEEAVGVLRPLDGLDFNHCKAWTEVSGKVTPPPRPNSSAKNKQAMSLQQCESKGADQRPSFLARGCFLGSA